MDVEETNTTHSDTETGIVTQETDTNEAPSTETSDQTLSETKVVEEPTEELVAEKQPDEQDTANNEPLVHDESAIATTSDEPESEEYLQTMSYRIPKLSEGSDKASDIEDTVNISVDQGSDNEELLVEDSTESKPEQADNDDGSAQEEEPKSKNDKPRQKRSRSRSPRRRTGSRDIMTDTPRMIRSRVFVGHLNTDALDKDKVQRLFAPYGKVLSVSLHNGYGFVQYDNEDSAKAAIKEVHGTPLGGMKIVVDKTVKLKKLLGENPNSEPPLPKSPPHRRSRDRYDSEMDYRRERELRYARLEEMERRYLYERADRLHPMQYPPRSRDPYFDRVPYMERLPPPRYTDYDRGHYGNAERRDRYTADPYDRRRDNYGDYGRDYRY